ncbi:MAG: TetR/AcrR family transcriptional regulator [Candidatus Riflebacteria bacterium]|nr:TetR/AcrR family transcriptional regulator [Candidatus Riflebacteria bacterium]
MLKKKKFSEITVAEICQKAGCSRNAFYSHFEDKDMLYNNLITKVIENIKKDCVLSVSKKEDITEMISLEYMKSLLNSMKKERKLLFILFSQNKNDVQKKIADLVFDSFIKNAKNISQKSNNLEFHIVCRYASVGFVELLNQCIKYNLQEKDIYKICQKITLSISPLIINYL